MRDFDYRDAPKKLLTPEILKNSGIIKNAMDGIKVLGNGTLEKKLIVWKLLLLKIKICT